MKKITSLICSILIFSNLSYADCDFKTGIAPGPNNTFIYTQECHLRVGQLVKDLSIRDQQVADLNKAIELKDLAIKYSDERANLWMDTSAKLENRIQTIDSLERKADWLYFGLGVVVMGFAVWGAGQLAK